MQIERKPTQIIINIEDEDDRQTVFRMCHQGLLAVDEANSKVRGGGEFNPRVRKLLSDIQKHVE
jgi:hypothetical protein